MLKKSKWLLFALIIIACAITLFVFNYSKNKNQVVNDSSKSAILATRKNLDSLTIEEIRTRYLNNPCYLALLKDPNMWEKGTRPGFDYKDLINDSLSGNHPYKNRFIVGDFNSVPLDGKKTGIYEIYPSLSSLSEFKTFPKELLEKLDTIYFRAANFMSVKMKSNSLKELYINAQNEGTFTSLCYEIKINDNNITNLHNIFQQLLDFKIVFDNIQLLEDE
jgi:hypothetical protein